MVFKKYNSKNNAICSLYVWISNSSLTMTATGNYDRFSTTNFIVRVTYYTDWVLAGRENMLITSRSGATFIISNRAYEPVPINDNASTNIQQALVFPAGAIIEEVASSEFMQDIQNEVARLDSDKMDKSWGTFTNKILEAKGANIASASTVNLATATGNYVQVTGTTTITGFWSVTAGAVFRITFTWALTLTYNATSLILPTSANITTQAWDTMIMVSEWSGNWRVLSYQRRNGQSLDNSTNIWALTENTSPTTSWFWMFFNGTSNFKISLANLVKGLWYATKVLQWVLRFATDAEAVTGTVDTVAITAKQAKDNYGLTTHGTQTGVSVDTWTWWAWDFYSSVLTTTWIAYAEVSLRAVNSWSSFSRLEYRATSGDSWTTVYSHSPWGDSTITIKFMCKKWEYRIYCDRNFSWWTTLSGSLTTTI